MLSVLSSRGHGFKSSDEINSSGFHGVFSFQYSSLVLYFCRMSLAMKRSFNSLSLSSTVKLGHVFRFCAMIFLSSAIIRRLMPFIPSKYVRMCSSIFVGFEYRSVSGTKLIVSVCSVASLFLVWLFMPFPSTVAAIILIYSQANCTTGGWEFKFHTGGERDVGKGGGV